MTTSGAGLVLAMSAAFLPLRPPPDGECPVFVLRRTPAGVTLERRDLAAGEHRLTRSAETGILDVILPVGPGVSGGLAQLGEPAEIVLSFRDGALGVTDRIGDAELVRPARLLADLVREDVRVSVVGGDGSRAAFLIDRQARVVPDDGPVMDMFRGRLPLGPDDYAVVTETWVREAGAPVTGTAALEVSRWPFVTATGPGGREGCFLVDIGAGSTVVGRAFVGDVPVEEAVMVQYSAGSRQLLKYTPSGATGPTRSVIGQALLPELVVGGLRFPDARVDVMDALPDMFGRPVDGILGIDLLRRCGVLSLRLGAQDAALTLSARAGDAADGAFELPFSFVSTHLAVTGRMGAAEVHWLLDSGAPGPLLDASAAQAAGLQVEDVAAGAGRGLDGGQAELFRAAPATLTLGPRSLADVGCAVSALPVFDMLRAPDQHVGLLGTSVLGRFEKVEIDFGRRVVRWTP